MIKIFSILLIVSLLASCSNQGGTTNEMTKIQKSKNDQLGMTTKEVNIIDSKETTLSQDIETLVKKHDVSLLISQDNGDFVPATPQFSQRIRSILNTHGNGIWRSVDIDNYNLIMRFQGYKDIHMNLNEESFWFEGSDQLYRIPKRVNLTEQWNRSMIRLVDGKLMYDSFEKTILRKGVFTDENQIENTATLFYDGDVRLSVNKSDTVVDSNVPEWSLSDNDSNHTKHTYSLEFLGESPLITVINDYTTVRGPAVKLDLFSYIDQNIESVFSSKDLICRIYDVEMKEGKVVISLPFDNTTVEYLLTEQERERSDQIVTELIDNQIEINDEFIKSISENIICSPIEIAFADVDDDGKEELLLLTNIHTIGAKTPIKINSNAVFIFEIKDNMIQYKEVDFERDEEKEKSLFSYFQ